MGLFFITWDGGTAMTGLHLGGKDPASQAVLALLPVRTPEALAVAPGAVPGQPPGPKIGPGKRARGWKATWPEHPSQHLGGYPGVGSLPAPKAHVQASVGKLGVVDPLKRLRLLQRPVGQAVPPPDVFQAGFLLLRLQMPWAHAIQPKTPWAASGLTVPLMGAH